MTEEKKDGRKSLPQAYKKGQSGNPNGRPKGAVSIPKELRTINSKLIAETINKHLNKSMEEVAELIRSKDTPMIDLVVLRILYEAAKRGDQTRFNALLERMVGKVPDKVDHTTNGKSVLIQFVTPKEGSNDSGNED